MASSKLSLIESQLSLGQVKRITTGDTLNYVEMLVGDTTKARLYNDTNTNTVKMEVADTSLELAQLQCSLGKDTVRSLILALKDMYNQLSDETETE